MKQYNYLYFSILIVFLLSVEKAQAQFFAEAGPDTSICLGLSVRIGGNPTGPSGATFQWSNSATLDSSTIANPIAAPSVTTTYTVTVSDINGRSATDQVTVTVNASADADAGPDTTICKGQSVQIGGNPTGALGATYQWSDAGSLDDSTLANPTASPSSNTDYMVTVTVGGSCSEIDTVSVSISDLAVAASVNSNVTCPGGMDGGASASASGGTSPYSFAWSNGDSTMAASGLMATRYTVSLTDSMGCIDTASIDIPEPTAIVITAVIDSNVSCNGAADGGVTASVVGGTAPYSYTWSNGDSTMSTTGLSAGNYTISLSDSIGCNAIDSITILEPLPLAISLTVDSNVTCHGGSDGGASAAINGGTAPYSFTWNNGDTSSTIVNLMAASYTLNVMDVNGCTNIDSVSISQPAPIDTAVTRNGITLTASNSQQGATFQWLDCSRGDSAILGATGQSFTTGVNGSYAVEITLSACVDTSSCTDLLTVGLGELTNIKSTIKLSPNPSNGIIDLALGQAFKANEPLLIYAYNGQLVYQDRLNQANSKLDLSSLGSGIYILRYQNILRKIVINR